MLSKDFAPWICQNLGQASYLILMLQKYDVIRITILDNFVWAKIKRGKLLKSNILIVLHVSHACFQQSYLFGELLHAPAFGVEWVSKLIVTRFRIIYSFPSKAWRLFIAPRSLACIFWCSAVLGIFTRSIDRYLAALQQQHHHHNGCNGAVIRALSSVWWVMSTNWWERY